MMRLHVSQAAESLMSLQNAHIVHFFLNAALLSSLQ